ncbi:tyrosine-type recombinase/integrase [Holophaga foetida]|uniref:tyrosine-type recombinase/integrase n=1 Tax=Holophaga foetida TaxID=35839 RepID=UPI0002473B55|nr:site-specific integrase [Holophaga foetida]
MGTHETPRSERKDREPVKLTKTEIEKLLPEAKEYFVPVVAHKGLNIRVLPNGTRFFVLRYRFDGIQRKHVMGTYPTMTPDRADKEWTRLWDDIHKRQEPNRAKADAKKAAEEERRTRFTVADLAERYELEHLPDNSASWQMNIKRYLARFILPALGKTPVKDVTPGDVSALLFKIGKDTPTQANRVRAVLCTMFQRAEEWSLRDLGTNPVAVVKARHQETKRDRRLTDAELVALGQAFRESKEAPEMLLAVRLGLLAGMRKGEIQGLRWEWVDINAGMIRIPMEAHKTGKKTGRARVVRLCSALVEDFKAIMPTLGCPYVVPGRGVVGKDKTRTWKPYTALQNNWERLRLAAKLTKEGKPEEQDPGLHDLRRTFASVAADLGLRGFVPELVGHVEKTVTDIYTRTAGDRLQEAAETIGVRIDGLLKGTIDPEKEAEERKKAQALKTKKTS